MGILDELVSSIFGETTRKDETVQGKTISETDKKVAEAEISGEKATSETRGVQTTQATTAADTLQTTDTATQQRVAETGVQQESQQAVGTKAGAQTIQTLGGAEQDLLKDLAAQLGAGVADPDQLRQLSEVLTSRAITEQTDIEALVQNALTGARQEFEDRTAPQLQSLASQVGGTGKTNTLVGQIEQRAARDLAATLAGTETRTRLAASEAANRSAATAADVGAGGLEQLLATVGQLKGATTESVETAETTQDLQTETVNEALRELTGDTSQVVATQADTATTQQVISEQVTNQETLKQTEILKQLQALSTEDVTRIGESFGTTNPGLTEFLKQLGSFEL